MGVLLSVCLQTVKVYVVVCNISLIVIKAFIYKLWVKVVIVQDFWYWRAVGEYSNEVVRSFAAFSPFIPIRSAWSTVLCSPNGVDIEGFRNYLSTCSSVCFDPPVKTQYSWVDHFAPSLTITRLELGVVSVGAGVPVGPDTANGYVVRCPTGGFVPGRQRDLLCRRHVGNGPWQNLRWGFACCLSAAERYRRGFSHVRKKKKNVPDPFLA